MSDANKSLRSGREKHAPLLQNLLIGITLTYWLFVPTGMLIPGFLGLEIRHYFLGVFFGLILVIATAVQGKNWISLIGVPSLNTAITITIFLCFLAISAQNAINAREGIYSSYAFYLLAILGGTGTFMLARSRGSEAATAVIGCFCASFLIYLIFFALNLDAMLAQAKDNWAFAFWPFGNIRTVAIYFLPCIVGAVVLSNAKTPNTRSRCFAFAAIIGLTFLFWTGSRGPVVAVMASLILVAILMPSSDRRAFLTTALIRLLLSSLLSLTLPRMNGSYGFWQRLIELAQPGTPDVLSLRGGVWTYTIEKILSRPWTGYGFGSYLSHADAEAEWRRHPHNDILQLWHDFGLVGGSAGILLIASTALTGMKNQQGDPRALAAIGMTASLLTVSMVDTVVVYAGNFTTLSIVLGLSSGLAKRAA